MHMSWRTTTCWKACADIGIDSKSVACSVEYSSSIVIRSFNTVMRSLKKSILTRWAKREMPESAAGSRGVGVGFLRIRKYSAKRSFNVSVCYIPIRDVVWSTKATKGTNIYPLTIVFRSSLSTSAPASWSSLLISFCSL